MYLTGFDFEKVAQFCFLFKKSSPPSWVCVRVAYFALQRSEAVFELCVVLDQLLCALLLRGQGFLQRVLRGSQTGHILVQSPDMLVFLFYLTHGHTQTPEPPVLYEYVYNTYNIVSLKLKANNCGSVHRSLLK